MLFIFKTHRVIITVNIEKKFNIFSKLLCWSNCNMGLPALRIGWIYIFYCQSPADHFCDLRTSRNNSKIFCSMKRQNKIQIFLNVPTWNMFKITIVITKRHSHVKSNQINNQRLTACNLSNKRDTDSINFFEWLFVYFIKKLKFDFKYSMICFWVDRYMAYHIIPHTYT